MLFLIKEYKINLEKEQDKLLSVTSQLSSVKLELLSAKSDLKSLKDQANKKDKTIQALSSTKRSLVQKYHKRSTEEQRKLSAVTSKLASAESELASTKLALKTSEKQIVEKDAEIKHVSNEFDDSRRDNYIFQKELNSEKETDKKLYVELKNNWQSLEDYKEEQTDEEPKTNTEEADKSEDFWAKKSEIKDEFEQPDQIDSTPEKSDKHIDEKLEDYFALKVAQTDTEEASNEEDEVEWFQKVDLDVTQNELKVPESFIDSREGKKIIIGVLIVFGLLIFGAIWTYSEFWSDEPATVSENPQTKQSDYAIFRTQFNRALTSERLIAPPENNAHFFLLKIMELKPDANETEIAYSSFIEKVEREAREFEAIGEWQSVKEYWDVLLSLEEDNSTYATQGNLAAEQIIDAGNVIYDFVDDGDSEVENAGQAGITEGDVDDKEIAKENEVKLRKEEAEKEKEAKAKKEKEAKAKKEKEAKAKKKKEAKAKKEESLQKIKIAQTAFRNGEYNEARTLFEESIELNGKNAVAYAGLGDIYFQENNLGQAAKYHSKAIRYSPKSSSYLTRLGQDYYKQGKYAEAIEQWQKALKYAKNDKAKARLEKFIEIAQDKM